MNQPQKPTDDTTTDPNTDPSTAVREFMRDKSDLFIRDMTSLLERYSSTQQVDDLHHILLFKEYASPDVGCVRGTTFTNKLKLLKLVSVDVVGLLQVNRHICIIANPISNVDIILDWHSKDKIDSNTIKLMSHSTLVDELHGWDPRGQDMIMICWLVKRQWTTHAVLYEATFLALRSLQLTLRPIVMRSASGPYTFETLPLSRVLSGGVRAKLLKPKDLEPSGD